MNVQEIGVADLLLDLQNPRHERQSTQREAIAALLDDNADKLLRLATSIAEHGLSPIDEFMVMRAEEPSTSYIVLEGNRRTAALKLLSNPELAGDHPYKKRFAELAKKAHDLPRQVTCAVAASREEAKPWLELRHGGENQGVGVIGWSPEARARWSSTRSGHRDWGLALVETVMSAFANNAEIQRDVAKVRGERLTTLGRLAQDKYFRQRLALEKDAAGLQWHYAAEDLEEVIGKIMSDLAGDVSVTDLKTHPLRRSYVEDVLGPFLPAASNYRPTAAPLPPAKKKGSKPKPKPKPTPPPPPPPPAPKPLFDGLQLSNLGSRISGVLVELQSLRVDKHPNACAALLRVVVELSVYQVHEAKKGKVPTTLRNGIQWCLQQVDPTSKDARYQGVRVGLTDGTSVLAIATMHAYLHNVNFHVTPTELRSIAANYKEFLAALDGLV